MTRQFERKDYELIHVDVEMSRTICEKCKNQRIGAYVLDHKSPQTGKTAIEVLGNLTLVATLVNNVHTKFETHHFRFVPEGPTFSLVFLSEGSCTRIKKIEISIFVCERNISDGVNLTRTIAPATGSKRRNATCIKNTLNVGNAEPYGLCLIEGIWDVRSSCACKKGFTLDTTGKCVGRLILVISNFL